LSLKGNAKCHQGSKDSKEDTGCYLFASLRNILNDQGIDLSKELNFLNTVEVADGFHFYYNNDDDYTKLDEGEVYNI
jgi:hypothetical protein